MRGTQIQAVRAQPFPQGQVMLCPFTLTKQTGTGTASTTFNDFAVSIQVGANNVPSNQFDISWLANNINNGGSILMFPSPVLVLFQQPLAVTVETKTAITGTGSDANNRTVVIDLIGELAIQKAPPGYRGA